MSDFYPSRWAEVILGEYAYIKARIGWRGLSSSEYTEKGPYLIAGTHIKGLSVDWGNCDHISEYRYDESPEIQLQEMDVVISKDGTIGRLGFIENMPGPATINGTMMLVRPNDYFFSKFIYYYLQGDSFQTLVKEKVSGSSVPHIFQRDMVSLKVPFPPLPEQQKIAAILTSVDEVIEKTQAQIDKLKDLKTAMMQELLTDGVGTKQASAGAALNNSTACRESYIPHTEFKDSPVGRIPKSWAVVTLRDVVIAKGLQTGPFGSQLHAHEYVENGVPVVMPKNMKSNRVSCKGIAQITAEKAATLSKHKVLSGDILFSRRGDIGRFALVEDVNEGSICGTGCLKARLNDSMSSSFFAAYLTLEYVVEWLINNSVGQTMLNLNTSILATLPVLKPPLEEQNKISSVITSLDMSITLKERKLLAQQNTKKALMQDLLTGKVRVNMEAS
ncbi:restriction endonuclease subunit S [Shewanella sp. 5S214]|uniref:restriction endonuclease subunit S n=1 Tax=Shewanella sp. 5S214 TaxID=3229999 RepID=UPI00352E5D89